MKRRLVGFAVLALAFAIGDEAQAKPAKRHAAAHKPAPAQTQERSVAPPPRSPTAKARTKVAKAATPTTPSLPRTPKPAART